jgi:hypothetical protein
LVTDVEGEIDDTIRHVSPKNTAGLHPKRNSAQSPKSIIAKEKSSFHAQKLTSIVPSRGHLCLFGLFGTHPAGNSGRKMY